MFGLPGKHHDERLCDQGFALAGVDEHKRLRQHHGQLGKLGRVERQGDEAGICGQIKQTSVKSETLTIPTTKPLSNVGVGIVRFKTVSILFEYL